MSDTTNSQSDSYSLSSTLTKVTSSKSDTTTLIPESESTSKSKPETLIFSRLAPLRVNMRITTQYHKSESLYFIDVGGMFGDNTTVTLHAKDKSGPILGKSSFNKFRSSKIGFTLRGGQKSTMNLVSDHGYYQWHVPIPRASDTSSQKLGETTEQFFIWRRAAGLDRDPRSAEALNLELCTPDPYKVHAIYTGALPGTGRGGVLELKDEFSGDFRVMVLLSLSVLVEKARQKRDRNGDNTARLMAFA